MRFFVLFVCGFAAWMFFLTFRILKTGVKWRSFFSTIPRRYAGADVRDNPTEPGRSVGPFGRESIGTVLFDSFWVVQPLFSPNERFSRGWMLHAARDVFSRKESRTPSFWQRCMGWTPPPASGGVFVAVATKANLQNESKRTVPYDSCKRAL